MSTAIAIYFPRGTFYSFMQKVFHVWPKNKPSRILVKMKPVIPAHPRSFHTPCTPMELNLVQTQVWMAMEQYQAGQVVTIPSRLSLSGNMDFPDLTVCPVFAAGVNQRTISRNISRIYQEVSKKTEGLIMLVGMKLLQLVNKTE